MTIVPNPTKHYFTISYELEEVQGMELYICDRNGKDIRRIKLETASGKLVFPNNELPEGTYDCYIRKAGSILDSGQLTVYNNN